MLLSKEQLEKVKAGKYKNFTDLLFDVNSIHNEVIADNRIYQELKVFDLKIDSKDKRECSIKIELNGEMIGLKELCAKTGLKYNTAYIYHSRLGHDGFQRYVTDKFGDVE